MRGASGTYLETINSLGKAISVRSSGGAEATTIDVARIGGSVVTCASGEGPDTVLVRQRYLLFSLSAFRRRLA